MDIFLDFEKTLLKDDYTLSEYTKHKLSELALKHSIYILTFASINQVRKLLPDQSIHIISVVENRLDPDSNITLLPQEVVTYLLWNPYVFSIHSIKDEKCIVFKYQERLKRLYSCDTIRLAEPESTYALLFACFKEGFQEIQEHLSTVHMDVLAEDNRKLLCKITSSPATKSAFVKKLKKSPAIGIGDSLEDYAFIHECETQVAVKNADSELVKLCTHQTKKTNNEDGVIHFLLNYLKHQQV